MTTLVVKEFTSNDRNPNVNGGARVLSVTQDAPSGPVRMTISGLVGTGLNTRLQTISDETVPEAVWLAYRDVLLASIAS